MPSFPIGTDMVRRYALQVKGFFTMSKDQKTALLGGIAEACQRLDLAQADADKARNARDQVIMEALAAGVRQVDVAKAAGMTRDGVYKLALRHGGV